MLLTNAKENVSIKLNFSCEPDGVVHAFNCSTFKVEVARSL